MFELVIRNTSELSRRIKELKNQQASGNNQHHPLIENCSGHSYVCCGASTRTRTWTVPIMSRTH